VDPALVADPADALDGVPVFEGVRLGAQVSARTPASSANLGPGLVLMGIALCM